MQLYFHRASACEVMQSAILFHQLLLPIDLGVLTQYWNVQLSVQWTLQYCVKTPTYTVSGKPLPLNKML